MANKLKMIRDNEENLSLRNDTDLQEGDMSEVLYALARHLCYKYDLETEEYKKEILLGYLARVKLYLIMMEEVEHKGKKLPARKHRESIPAILEELVGSNQHI